MPLAVGLSGETRDALIGAAVGIVLTLLLGWAVDRVLARREDRVAARLPGETAAVRTRLRLLRRIVVAVIVVVLVANALLQIPQARGLAGAVLASSAVVALIAGLAVRTPLANMGAGILIAALQPIRLGDRVTVAGEAGVVTEITLSYTVLQSDDNRRVFIPNEQLIASTIVNATIDDPTRAVTVDVPLRLRAPVERARAAVLDALGGIEQPEGRDLAVAVAAVTPHGATLAVTAWAVSGTEAGRLGPELRERALTALQREDLLPPEAPGG